MRILALLTSLMFGACSTDVVTTPVPVNIPVSVPCHVPSVTAPVWATSTINAQDTLFDQFKALAVTNEQRKGYEANLLAVIRACQ